MKLATFTFIIATVALIATGAGAETHSRLVAQTQVVARPIADVFATLKQYFSDPMISRFQLISANSATHSLIAKESGIDQDTWSSSAFCVTSPLQMMFGFKDGTVTVTVNLSKTPKVKHSTLVSVTADFKGIYGNKSEQHEMNCLSKGTLEKEVLAAAAAAPTPPAK
ncbi:MAG TPA: hypothetical protein VMU16_03785 [Candidatus Binataceae bacterium]|nr:hypothetical protein [Candidatus Binataceae bacterium]